MQTYAQVHDVRAERRSLENGRILQGKLWGIAWRSARRDPYYMDLSRSVIDTIAVADQQEAALNNHVPLAIIGIILLCTLVGAFLIEAMRESVTTQGESSYGSSSSPNPK